MFYQFQHFGISEYFCKEYGKNFSFPAHLHQSFEFITVLSGEMDITVDDKTYKLSSGESLLIFPHQLHSLSSTNSKHMLCIFSPDIVKAYYSKISKKVPESNKFVPNKHIIHSIDKLSEDNTQIKKKGVLYSVCAEFDDTAKYHAKNNDDKNLLYKIFEFVELNYNKDCSLERLSKETAFSYSYLSRYFKNTIGISFNYYVNQCRINNACYILNNFDCSILQCALDSGYTSLRSFNRNFKTIVGTTPQEYKNRVINSSATANTD